jgi:hypothetical protein
MKIKLALSLLAVALVSACTTTKTASNTRISSDDKSMRYANNAIGEPAPPADGPTADIPSQGPSDINANPAYMPTPLLRSSAAGGP